MAHCRADQVQKDEGANLHQIRLVAHHLDGREIVDRSHYQVAHGVSFNYPYVPTPLS